MYDKSVHTTNDHGDCVHWCQRCKDIERLENKFKDYLQSEIYEHILDLESEISHLKGEHD